METHSDLVAQGKHSTIYRGHHVILAHHKWVDRWLVCEGPGMDCELWRGTFRECIAAIDEVMNETEE